MRIATWNINGVRARLEFVELWLAERQPDIVGFQELKSEDDQFPHDELARRGYHAVVLGQKAWNGVAVLSRTPVEVTASGLPGQEAAGARMLAVQLGSLHFVTVYCPNGKSVDHPDFTAKLAWYDSLLDFVDSTYRPDQNVVLCGDFNVVPDALDSWSESLLEDTIFHTRAERQRIEALRSWGFRDVWRERNPTQPGFTWWDYRAGAFKKKKGLRIDFMLATRSLYDRARFIQPDQAFRDNVGGLIPSDHAPLYMDIGGD